MSHTSLNVTWTSAEPSTQLRGVARNYSVYLWVTDVSSWQVRDTVTSLQHCKMHSCYNIRSQNKCIGDYTKGAARRSPNCVKYVLWNAGIIPLLKFCEKLLPHTHKISLNSRTPLAWALLGACWDCWWYVDGQLYSWTPGDVYSTVINQLESFTNYSVFLAVCNSVGCVNSSVSVGLTLLSGIPPIRIPLIRTFPSRTIPLSFYMVYNIFRPSTTNIGHSTV